MVSSPAEDTVSGATGSVTGAVEVALYTDDTMKDLIARGPVKADGSFGPLAFGDNRHAHIYVAALAKGGKTSSPLLVNNDIQAPKAVLTQTPPAIVETPTAILTFNCDSGPCKFECQLDKGEFSPCTSPHELKGLDKGDHIFKVRAVDEAGNKDPIPDPFAFMVDIRSPRALFNSTPQALTTGLESQFKFSCDHGECVFECQLDEGDYSPCASPHTVKVKAVGKHTFKVRPIQGIELSEGSTAVFTWEVKSLSE